VSNYFRHDYLKTSDGASIYFQYQVVRWHYRGHGRSPVPEEPERLGVDFSCRDLDQLYAHLGVESAVVFGHSMGVQVALEFHRIYPERVSGLALICGSYGNPLDTLHDDTLIRTGFPYVKKLVETFPHAVRKLTSVALKTELAIEITLRMELNRHLMPRLDLVPYFHHLANMDPLAFVRTLDSLKDHSAWDHLSKVRVPTLIIGGEQDRFTPVWLSKRMAEEIPTAEFTLVPGGSHTAPLEQPSLISKRIDRFLRKHFPVPTGVRSAAALGS
jgi:pimeloyl-ACP methyl ester carboxylesterase